MSDFGDFRSDYLGEYESHMRNGWYVVDLWKKQESKISGHCHFKHMQYCIVYTNVAARQRIRFYIRFNMKW
jgi:hypothetical protein